MVMTELEPKQKEPDVKFTVDLGALLGRATAPVTETVQLLAYGLALTEDAHVEHLDLPGAVLQLRGSESGADLERIRDLFAAWLTGTAVRRYIEVFSAFLEDFGFIAALVRRVVVQEHFDETVVRKKHNALSFPDKLAVGHIVGVQLDNTFVEMLDSINVARNCYEHRRGVVGLQDVRGGDSLEVKWYRAVFTVASAEGADEEVKELPAIIEPGGSFTGRYVITSRRFRLGETIGFTPSEVGDMGLTFMLAAQQLVGKMPEAAERFERDRPGPS